MSLIPPPLSLSLFRYRFENVTARDCESRRRTKCFKRLYLVYSDNTRVTLEKKRYKLQKETIKFAITIKMAIFKKWLVPHLSIRILSLSKKDKNILHLRSWHCEIKETHGNSARYTHGNSYTRRHGRTQDFSRGTKMYYHKNLNNILILTTAFENLQ